MTEAIITDSDIKDPSKPITSSPATTDLYNIDYESPVLKKKDSDHFHSMVARIAYVARMARLECIGSVAFLTTRVTKSTEQDMQKLHHLIRYLHQSHELDNKCKTSLVHYFVARKWKFHNNPTICLYQHIT